MNPKRIIIAILAVFLTIVATDFLIHGLWTKPNYVASANMWRPEATMQKYMPWVFGGQFVIAIGFTMIWARIALGGAGLICALAYGFFVGLLFAGNSLIVYGVQPIEHHIIMKWIIGGLVQGVIVGFIAFQAYKPSKPCPPIG